VHFICCLYILLFPLDSLGASNRYISAYLSSNFFFVAVILFHSLVIEEGHTCSFKTSWCTFLEFDVYLC
jgi:hypothetical protein